MRERVPGSAVGAGHRRRSVAQRHQAQRRQPGLGFDLVSGQQPQGAGVLDAGTEALPVGRRRFEGVGVPGQPAPGPTQAGNGPGVVVDRLLALTSHRAASGSPAATANSAPTARAYVS